MKEVGENKALLLKLLTNGYSALHASAFLLLWCFSNGNEGWDLTNSWEHLNP